MVDQRAGIDEGGGQSRHRRRTQQQNEAKNCQKCHRSGKIPSADPAEETDLINEPIRTNADLENADKTVANEQLLQDIWGRDDSDTEPLRTYIRRLRDKLEDNPPRTLLTDHGTGYRFVTHK